MEFNFKISKSFILLVDDINGISAQPGCLAVLDILDFDLNRDLIGDLNTLLIGDLNTRFIPSRGDHLLDII